MKNPIIVAILSFILLAPRVPAVAAEFDEELSNFATKLSGQINDKKKQKITVLDFTDLQGASSELGRYIAEELTVNLVVGKREFAVLDRANLNSILAEHKLTATGLVDPENAKKLGAFAGVDALVLGNLVPLGPNIQIIAKVISTDTAEIIGAAKCLIQTNATIGALLAKPTEPKLVLSSEPQKSEQDAKGSIYPTNRVDDLQIEYRELSLVGKYTVRVEMMFKNTNKTKSLWTSVRLRPSDGLSGIMITGPDGNDYEYAMGGRHVGMKPTGFFNDQGFASPVEIAPGDTQEVVIELTNQWGDTPLTKKGLCRLRMDLFLANDRISENQSIFESFRAHKVRSLVTSIELK